MTDIRAQRINQIIEHFIQAEGLQPESLLESLGLFVHDPDIQYIYQKLTEMGDMKCYLWLIKYLVAIERPCSMDYLYQLSQHENEIVRREACEGVTKASPEFQGDILVRLLESGWKGQQTFAIKELGDQRYPHAVIPLLTLLDRNGDDIVQGVAIITTLGKIRDHRAFPVLEKIAYGPQHAVQEAALLALTRFNRKIDRVYIKKCLVSPNPRLREFVYLHVIKYRVRGWEAIITEALYEEPEDILMSILSSLKEIKHTQLMGMIFFISIHGDTLNLRIMAQSAVRRNKSRFVFRWLCHNEKKYEGEIRAMILRFLIEYKDHPNTFKILKKNFENEQDQRLRLISLEGMGRIQHPTVISYLMNLLKDKSVFSYSAAVALGHQIRHDTMPLVIDILESPETFGNLPVQYFLKFILRLPKTLIFSPRCHQCIGELIQSPCPHIRYLSGRCLERIDEQGSVVPLLLRSRYDPNAMVREGALIGLVSILMTRPDALIGMLTHCLEDNTLYPKMNRLFKTMNCSPMSFDRILYITLVLISESLNEGSRQSRYTAIRLMVLLRHQIKRHKAFLFEHLEHDVDQWVDSTLSIIITVMHSAKFYRVRELPFHVFARYYPNVSVETKLVFLRFFALLPLPHKIIEQVILDDYLKAQDPRLRQMIESVLSQWIGRNMQMGWSLITKT